MTVVGNWEYTPGRKATSEDSWENYPANWDLTFHPAEALPVPDLSDEELEMRCEQRWATITLTEDGKFCYEVGYVYFYPVVTDKGICDTLEEAQEKAEEIFADKYVINFEKTLSDEGII